MAHFAKLDENNIVTEVIVVGNDCITDENGIEQEELGIAFCKRLYGEDTNWKQTSYNGKFRKRFAGVGLHYNEDYDMFTPIKPFPSWVFDVSCGVWVPPSPRPIIPVEISTGPIEVRNFWNEEKLEWETKMFYNSEWQLYKEPFA